MSDLTLPIVVRLERTYPGTHEEVCQAVASAFARIYAAVCIDPAHPWRPATDVWTSDDMVKKVVRRARGNHWFRLEELPEDAGVRFTQDGVEGIILPPTAPTALPLDIVALQVAGTDVSRRGENARMLVETGVFCAAVNPDLVNMSTGKTVAQVCHAVQYAIDTWDANILQPWIADGCPVLVTTDIRGWDDAESTAYVSVTDAGLTEIPSGSNTVKGYLL